MPSMLPCCTSDLKRRLDIEDFLNMCAARAQKPRHLLLVLRAIELRFHRIWRCRHLTERQRGREDFDEERFHKVSSPSLVLTCTEL